MAITDINISEQLETGAPSIKYTGKEGPRPSMQSQQEMMIAQQIWEAMGDEERGQFSNFQEFFRSGIWKQILQQAQQDEAQGIASLGPRNMEQGPRLGAEYGGRIGFKRGTPGITGVVKDKQSEIMNVIKKLIVATPPGQIVKLIVDRYQIHPDVVQEMVISQMTDANEGFEPPVGTADEGYRPEIGIESSAEDPWDIPEKPRERYPTIRDWLDKIKEEGYPDRADFEDPGFPGGRGKIWGGKIPYEPSELQAYDQGERTGLPGRRQILVPSSFLNNKEDIREEQVGIETLRGRR